VDYQNIQKFDASKLKENDNVIVFVGVKPESIKTDIVILVQKLSERGCFFQVEGAGKNAVDLHIAFRAGQLSIVYPGSSFQVLSKDGDFIPLVDYLNKQGIKASNGTTLAKVVPVAPAEKATPVKRTPRQLATDLLAKLNKPKATKPRTLLTLRNHLNTLQKDLTDAEFKSVVDSLKGKKAILVDDKNNITYPPA
jgi:PIN domain